MEMNRRKFLCWSSAASALILLDPKSVVAKQVPQIWGDGVHDDAPGINALLRGQPCQIMTDSVYRTINGKVHLNLGTFLVKSPIIIDKTAADSVITGCTFENRGASACIEIRDVPIEYAIGVGYNPPVTDGQSKDEIK